MLIGLPQAEWNGQKRDVINACALRIVSGLAANEFYKLDLLSCCGLGRLLLLCGLRLLLLLRPCCCSPSTNAEGHLGLGAAGCC